jgi:poly-gamma-glutamate synthesis protein (capsule biosynthesis protein)
VLALVDSRNAAVLWLDIGDPETGVVYAERVYALAAPFPTLADGIPGEALLDWWADDGPALRVAPATAAALTALWGESGGSARITPANELLQAAWDGDDWAVVPFDRLRPEWKVIAIDGENPLRNDFDPDSYPLTVRFTLQGDPDLVAAITALYGPGTPQPLVRLTNRDPGKLTIVVMTGVTALVRATAFAMENQGLLYPARDIGDWLRSASILHISNEVPFA